MRHRITLFLLFALSACAMQQEAIVLEEPALDITQDVIICTPDDEDGIGGTGCEPVARSSLDHVLTD